MSVEEFFAEASDESRVKQSIVTNYFEAWANVMVHARGRREKRIAFIDLFAGPGRYEDGTPSTPLLVLETAIRKPEFRDNLVTHFNDQDPEQVGRLANEIDGLQGISTLRYRPHVSNLIVGREVVEALRAMSMVPSLVFIDPWGYKGLSLELIEAAMKDWGSECILFFNYNRVNITLGRAELPDSLVDVLGETRTQALWSDLQDPALRPQEREERILEELTAALESAGDPKRFVLPFCFKSATGARTSHYVILVTKHFAGYDIMKQIMAKRSSSEEQGVPSFAYCEADERCPRLFALSRPLDALAEVLRCDMAGRSIRVEELYREHSVGTPFILKNYKTALKQLEESGQIAVRSETGKPRRKGTMADHLVVTFPQREQG